MSRTIILLSLIFVISFLSKGQTPAVYNINKYNGLSTNHVYCLLVDRLGYLWMGTTDGVYRYNGYTLRKYDYSDGLPNIDVWNLYEDKQGRIWFRAIAQQMGYVRNGKFYKLHRSAGNPDLEIYPGTIKELDNGEIVFLNTMSNIKGNLVFCFSGQDTLQTKVFTARVDTQTPVIVGKFIIHAQDSFVYLYNLKKELFSTRKPSRYGDPEKIRKVDAHLGKNITKYPLLYTFANKYYCFYRVLLPELNILNIETGKINKFDIGRLTNNKTNRIIFCHSHTNTSVCITEHTALIIDSNLKIRYFPFSTLFAGNTISGFNTTYFMEDDTWDMILATRNSGIYIRRNIAQRLRKMESDLNNYKFVNNKNDTVGYWWNEAEHMLATVYNGRITKKIHLQDLYSLKKIVSYDSTRNIIANETRTSWLYNNNDYSPITHGITELISPDTLEDFNPIGRGTLNVANDIYVTEGKEIYLLGINLRTMSIDEQAKRINFRIVQPERYRNILFNYRYNTLICYTHNKILLLNENNQKILRFNQSNLETLGFNTIEKVMVDANGNLFIKDYNSLKVVNSRNGRIKTLFSNLNLKQAKTEIIGANIIIAGNFGILKAAIQPNGDVKITDAFQNTKFAYYKYLIDAQFASNQALLKTDNGTYIYDYQSTTNHTSSDIYRTIANYRDSLFMLSQYDTLNIFQDAGVIGLDIIKPTGTGNLNITYSINGGAFNNTGYQLILPSLSPGSYNTVSLIASDDSWRSQPLKFTVYIQPKWWQTHTAKRVIFVLSLLTFIGFIYMVIVMTRRFVNRNNERRNQRRELELKSIYSQINPHFIFNSLSTAQYFVKKNKNKEAFEHINQFSDLLRSYIKSSRAKYITIAEEIENLENYLQLQLTRFEEKFDYTIEVDKSVDAGRVKIPSLLLQPLVENALNHGIFHSDKKGNLSVIFKIDEQDKDTLVCIVDDDGIGRQRAKELRGKIIRKADSYGTILIKELIDTFNKYEKIKIEIEYIDKQPPLSGTTVAVRISNYAQSQ